MKNAVYFVVGFVFWVVTLAIITGVFLLIGPGLSGASSSSLSFKTILLVVVGFIGFIPVYWGLNLASQTLFGARNSRYTPVVILLIMFTVIGMIPVCYWTGKALVIRYHGEL